MDDEIVRNWDVHQHGLYRDADHGKGSLVDPTHGRGAPDKFDNTVYVDDAVLFAHENELQVGTVIETKGTVLIVHGPLYDRDYTRASNQVMLIGNRQL